MTTFSSFQQQDTTPNTAQPQTFLQKNVENPISQAFSGGVNQIKEGASQIMNGQGNPIVNGVEGALKVGAGAVGAISSPLAPIVQRPIGAAINYAADKISNSSAVQQFANTPMGQNSARVAGDLSNAGAVAGGILGAGETTGAASNIWDKAYSKITGPNAVDAAQADVGTQAQSAASGLENATQQLSNYRNTTMGKEFQAGAQQIMDQNPNAHMVVPNEVLDKLNELKDTAKFQLPDYLRTSSNEFGNNLKLEDLSKNGVSLNPAEAQDLIRRVNQLTYAAKASGDLKVNQSTVGLVQDLHSIASDAFGNIKDTSGKSIWDNTYQNFSKSANVVSKMSDLINIDKNAGPVDMFNKLNSFKKLLNDPSGKVLLSNAVDELKQTTGIDLTDTAGNIQKLMDSEDTLKEAQKPGFIKQMFNPNMVGRLGMRVIMYATLGAWIKGAIKSLTP